MQKSDEGDGPTGPLREHRSPPGSGVLWADVPLAPSKETKYSAAWRETAQRRRLALFDDLARLADLNDDEQAERRYLVAELLKDSGEAINRQANLRKWWWGTDIERAWSNLREVEERTIDLIPSEELSAYSVRASARGHQYLEGGDPRLVHLDGLRVACETAPNDDDSAALRAATVQVLRNANAAIDRANQEARYLRNRIILASLLALLFGFVLVLTQWEVDEPFLATPSGAAPLSDPAWRYVIVVGTWGAIGALLTAIPAMTKTPADFGPFNLPLQQSMLKIVLGPLSAIVGFAVLSEEPFGATAPTQWPGLMLLAIAFGAGQQAVTRYVDQRAARILSAATPGDARGR